MKNKIRLIKFAVAIKIHRPDGRSGEATFLDNSAGEYDIELYKNNTFSIRCLKGDTPAVYSSLANVAYFELFEDNG